MTASSGGNQHGDEVQKDQQRSQLEARLNSLKSKLEEHHGEKNRHETPRVDNSGFGKAMKLSTEFIVSVVLGAGLGYMLDKYLGWAPWGMIVFLMIGFCAGVMSIMRQAGNMADNTARLDWKRSHEQSRAQALNKKSDKDS